MVQHIKKTRRLGRLLCLVLAFALLMPSLAPAKAATSYGVVMMDNVLFRKSPTTSDYWARLYTGWVAEILGTQTVGDTVWYQAKANLPHDLKNSFTGYLRYDVFRPMNETEQTAWLANPTQGSFGTVTGTLTGSSFAAVSLAGAPLRQTASATSVVITGFLVDQVVTILEAPTDKVNGWYKATGGGYIGYIYAGHIRLITAAEAATLQGGTATGSPPATGASGYAVITQASTNLRRTPGGVSLLQLGVNLRVPYYGSPQASGGYNWIYVRDPGTGTFGYVRSDCYRLESAPPVTTPGESAPTTEDGYVQITKHNVNLRRTPGGDTQLQILIDTILPYYGAPLATLGYYWIYVKHTNGTFGYIRSDCYRFVDAAGNPVTGPAQPAIPSTPSTPSTGTPPAGGSTGFIRLVRGGVNLRQSPGGPSFAQLDRGTELPYYGFAQQGGYTWYYVMSTKGAGYVRSDMAVMSGGTPSAPPSTGTGSVLGYVVTTKTGVNLRQSASSAAPIYRQLKLGSVWPIIGQVTRNQGYNWFHVNVDGRTGYLRGDVSRQMSAGEVTAYLAGTMPGTTPPTGGSPSTAAGYIMTTMNYVNIRLSPSLSATRLTQVAKQGTVFAFESTVNSGGRLWYRMTYNGQVCYMLASLARELTPAEVATYLGGTPSTPATTPTTPLDPADWSTTALTLLNRVLVRQSGSMSAKTISILYTAGSQVKLLGDTANADGYTWFKVFAGGVDGWIRGDMLRILSKDEEKRLNQVGDPDAPPEASYPTLSKGSTGAAVTRLQTELNRLGFLPASGITGSYTTETVDAVKAYQLAAGLFVDGIAGPNTQHKLYGTVPEGTYAPGGTGELYPMEKLDWSVVQNVWRNGTVATITDVASKLSFQAKRWSGLHHADVEPLTAADTAMMCRIYGVKNAQEIADKNLWQRRPVWVTVAGRSLAASVYGVPHNYPAGDTIPGNDFNGQFCVHFVNSRTHNTLNIDPGHMAAINTAYNSAPSKK